jgi:hypothetical protein
MIFFPPLLLPCSLTKNKNVSAISARTAVELGYASTFECGLSVAVFVLPASTTHHHTVNIQRMISKKND